MGVLFILAIIIIILNFSAVGVTETFNNTVIRMSGNARAHQNPVYV
jgi:hypothetical protein